MTFSIGTTPAAASPDVTASNTARKLPTAVRGASPNAVSTASSANAPGSPAYAIGAVVADMAGSVEVADAAEPPAGRRPRGAGLRQAADSTPVVEEASSANRSIVGRTSVGSARPKR